MRVEIESLDEFDAHVRQTGGVADCFVQSVPLTARPLSQLDVTGAIFFGCTFAPGAEAAIRRGGGLVFPRIPQLPFNPYRSQLWDAESLYEGLADGYDACTDGRIYRWWRTALANRDLEAELACTLHDHSMLDALGDEVENLAETQLVGIMGGHAAARGTARYLAAAEIGWRLTQLGKTVVTGGGPGAMEAANLGGACDGDLADVQAAVAHLADSPTWDADPTGWAKSALAVKAAGSYSRLSLGIPTWFYGHEPPNVFATHSAKFFNNALREESLLRLSRGGIVYTPGAAGTVQEVFQSVTDNYYAEDESVIVPLVLLGVEHWTQRFPVWPLLQSLGRGRAMEDQIHLVDSPEEAVALLAGKPLAIGDDPVG